MKFKDTDDVKIMLPSSNTNLEINCADLLLPELVMVLVNLAEILTKVMGGLACEGESGKTDTVKRMNFDNMMFPTVKLGYASWDTPDTPVEDTCLWDSNLIIEQYMSDKEHRCVFPPDFIKYFSNEDNITAKTMGDFAEEASHKLWAMYEETRNE